MPAQLLTISRRESDIELGRKISQAYGFVNQIASDALEVRAIVREYPQLVVLWDVDHADADHETSPFSTFAIAPELAAAVSPDRVVTVSDRPLNELPHLLGQKTFNHHFFRRSDPASFLIYARLATACLRPDPFGLEHYVPDHTPIKRIRLQRSVHRYPATEAVGKVFLASNGHPRLAAMLTQTCDELLMNAIFSAPVDGAGKRYRAHLARDSDLELGLRETVTLEYAAAGDYIAVLVSDSFGSLDRDAIFGFVEKDYEHQRYRPESTVSAGLGIYGILQSGQSLLFVTKPGARTDVAVFFPMVRSPKALKTAFRFVSFAKR